MVAGRPGDADLATLIESSLTERGVDWETAGPGHYLAVLPGTHKLRTTLNLILGAHSLRLEAFVMRAPDERREQLWAYLLQRNARMYGVAFAIDAVGDVYLTGRVSRAAVTAQELDRLLGAVLTYADENFDTMLEIGFGSAIRREWAWRVSRGESLDNLRAFAHLVDRPTSAAEQGTAGQDRPDDHGGTAYPAGTAHHAGTAYHAGNDRPGDPDGA